jgi:hypothetical protein
VLRPEVTKPSGAFRQAVNPVGGIASHPQFGRQWQTLYLKHVGTGTIVAKGPVSMQYRFVGRGSTVIADIRDRRL